MKHLLNFINKLDSKTMEMVRVPISKEERIQLIKDLNKYPGEQNLDERIFLSQTEGRKFLAKGSYDGELAKRSTDWIKYWDKQKELCYTGLLIDDEFFITGDAYFYLNFCIISFKSGEVQCPEIRDSDLWFFRLIELAGLQDKFTVTGKKRQWGFSLKLVSKIIKRFIFEKKFSGKLVAPDEKYVKSGWSEITSFRDHIHKHTAWKRPIMGAKLGWTQGQLMQDGTIHGLQSQLKGITTKNNPAAVVSGKTDEAFFDESGLDKHLLEAIGFLSAALKDGNIVYGALHVGGAAGSIKDSEDIKELFYNPGTHNMLECPNVWDGEPDKMVGIFVPAYYSFGNCKDKFGNSLIEEAKKVLEELGEIEKQKSFRDYMLFKSQNPVTTKDMFASREDNIFPVHIIQPYYEKLSEFYKPTAVEIYKGREGLTHSFNTKYPILEDWPVNKNSNKHGCVVIEEAPVPNAPFGLYYAGVDTITPIKTTSSISVQSVYIFKASHQLDGEYSQEKIVAWYSGRPEDPYEAFKITRDLIQYYNARALIENNNRNFIEWMINEKQQKYMMKRSEVPIGKDLIMNSGVDRSDYGINASRLKEYLTSLLVDYATEVIETKFDEEGKPYDVYGVERIPDKVLLKEMMGYTSKKNVDRCFLPGTKVSTNKGIVNIENIHRNKILNINGKYEKVKHVVKTEYTGNICNINLLGNASQESIKCTPEHKFYTAWSTTKYGKKPYGKFWVDKFKLNNKEWKSAEELKKGDYLLIPKRKKLKQSKLTWFEQYLLGWYISDGYAQEQKYSARVRIHFGEDQKHIAEFIQKELIKWDPPGVKKFTAKDRKLSFRIAKPSISRGWQGQKGWQLEFSSLKFTKILNQSTYWKDSKAPEYKTLKPKLYNCKNILPLILGIMEGDGHLKYTNYNSERMALELSLVNETLIKQIRQVLIDNNIWSTCEFKASKNKVQYIRNKKALFTKDQWKLHVADYKGIKSIIKGNYKFKPELLKILDRLCEKNQKQHHILKEEGFWVPIKSIEYSDYDGYVYNFESPKTNTYCVENVVTHNCDAICLALLAAKTSTSRGLIVTNTSNSNKKDINYSRRNVFSTQRRIKNTFL